MNWLRRAVVRWLNRPLTTSRIRAEDEVAGNEDFPFDTQFAIIKAANGVLLRVTKYRPTNSMHSDFQHELYIVQDGETAVDTIRRVLVLQQLEGKP
jgi:hypothetical protein